MSRTIKNPKFKFVSKIKLGKNMKLSAKEKRKTLKDETNPRVFKLKGANEWNIL